VPRTSCWLIASPGGAFVLLSARLWQERFIAGQEDVPPDVSRAFISRRQEMSAETDDVGPISGRHPRPNVAVAPHCPPEVVPPIDPRQPVMQVGSVIILKTMEKVPKPFPKSSQRPVTRTLCLTGMTLSARVRNATVW
jgi:hypothetical protein